MQLERRENMDKEYFKVLFAQLKLKLDYDGEKEFLIGEDEYFKQMDEVIKIIDNDCYDVILFPELAYHENYDGYFRKISKDKIIVFGSVYIDNFNYTIVYNNNEKFYVKKMFSSPVEPAIRYLENIDVKSFLKDCLKEHTFKLKNKKFVVLNCAEYYKVAYFIARDRVMSKDLFGFLVPCANNKVNVFLDESVAIHNHNEGIYSFIVNSVATYKNEKYSLGQSYVFGKISPFERSCLNKEYLLDRANNICYLNDSSYVVVGSYLCKGGDKYCRSDNFKHTPKNMKIIKIGEI